MLLDSDQRPEDRQGDPLEEKNTNKNTNLPIESPPLRSRSLRQDLIKVKIYG